MSSLCNRIPNRGNSTGKSLYQKWSRSQCDWNSGLKGGERRGDEGCNSSRAFEPIVGLWILF